MSTTPAQYIANNTIVPVSNTEKGSNEAPPGFFSAYEAAHKMRRNGDSEKEDQQLSQSDEEERAVDGELAKTWPEIFKLLKKYSFKEFLRLSVGVSEARLKHIIREGRKARGVTRFVPVSSSHSAQNVFIHQMAQQYFSTSKLMKRNAGQTYSGLI